MTWNQIARAAVTLWHQFVLIGLIATAALFAISFPRLQAAIDKSAKVTVIEQRVLEFFGR
jgi:hypothetical protein